MNRNPSNLIGRDDWDARYADGFDDRPVPVTEFWLHHSVTVAPDVVPPYGDDDAAVRTIERIGQQRFSGGMPYTALFTPVGRGYVGHSWWRRGAHTRGHNTAGAGLCLVGNYDVTPVTSEQVDEVAATMVAAHREGLATVHQVTGPHSQVYATACPGRFGRAAIPAINARAAQLWARGLPGRYLTEDGRLDAGTIRVFQKFLAAPVTGAWDAPTTRALQRWVRVRDDGVIGPVTTTALQRRVGAAVTGSWNLRSLSDPTTRAFEAYLNRGIRAGTFTP